MATIPNKIEKIRDLEKDNFSTISQASWQKVAGILEYVNKSYPLGMLLFFYASQDNLPENIPDPKYWKFMDGSVITNVNSIYNGMTTLDLRGKFIKHPGVGQTELTFGGANTVNIGHDHGGFTESADDTGNFLMDGGEERQGAFGPHIHGMTSGGSVVSTVPSYGEVQVYMRIV